MTVTNSERVPATMFAWRKHRGSPKPVIQISDILNQLTNIFEVFEEVPVPKVSPNGILCKMLASGGTKAHPWLLTKI
jgi:alcohol dehydrogenase, propanol-preferring